MVTNPTNIFVPPEASSFNVPPFPVVAPVMVEVEEAKFRVPVVIVRAPPTDKVPVLVKVAALLAIGVAFESVTVPAFETVFAAVIVSIPAIVKLALASKPLLVNAVTENAPELVAEQVPVYVEETPDKVTPPVP